MTLHELRTRLALDATVIARLRSPLLGAIKGFVAPDHIARGKAASVAELAAGHAVYWSVEYRLPMLAGPGAPLRAATAVFDLLAGGNYPYSSPSASFTSRPAPWCGHVHPVSGTICLGAHWRRANGQITLAHLVLHVMRLVNFDEPPTTDGFNAQALRYGVEVLHGGPLNPDLLYPTLPVDILHGVTDDEAVAPEARSNLFRPRATAAPAQQASTAVLFRPRAIALPNLEPVTFVPRRSAR